MCGREMPYQALPWFWSDQYDIKLQIAGLSTGFDEILIRGDMDEERFSAWYYQEDKLLAVDCVNAPREFMIAKKMLTNGVNPSKSDVINLEQDLAQLLNNRVKG